MSDTDLTTLTAQIVSAYVSHNTVASADLPGLLGTVYGALSNAGKAPTVVKAESSQAPAVPIKRSVTADSITCLDCGRKNKMLKRHLAAEHNLTTDEYRAKWKLPPEYPMVAPNYAAARSEMALKLGLGRKRKQPACAVETAIGHGRQRILADSG